VTGFRQILREQRIKAALQPARVVAKPAPVTR
jgi:hypothetical protein